MTYIMLMHSLFTNNDVMSLRELISAGFVTQHSMVPCSHHLAIVSGTCAQHHVPSCRQSCAWCLRESQHCVRVGTAAAPGAFQGGRVDPGCSCGVPNVANAV